MRKNDTGAIGNPLESVFWNFMKIELEVKITVLVIISFFKLRSRAFNCQNS